jgi:hypothetical protein
MTPREVEIAKTQYEAELGLPVTDALLLLARSFGGPGSGRVPGICRTSCDCCLRDFARTT